jgi:hypothetical protein
MWVGKRYGSCWFLWPLCVFGCISVVVESVCVRNCRGLGFCTVGTVGQSVGGECVRTRGSGVTGVEWITEEDEDMGKSG